MRIKNNKLLKKMDFYLILDILVICLIGVLVVASATHTHPLGSAGFIRTQIASIIIGFVAIVFILLFDYNILSKFYLPIYIFSNALLVGVLVFGRGADEWGANRWIKIGGFQFQPADFVKIGIIICLAKILSENKNTVNKPKTLLQIIGFLIVPMALIAVQPDLGTTMAFAVFGFGMLFIAGLKYKYIIITGVAGILSFPLMWLGVLKDYQKERILTFINPELDPTGKGYQIIQSKLAVGSGKLFGRGLFQGTQNRLGFLPERHNDFIFSVMAEELGFLGVSTLVVLYFILLYKCAKIARDAKDDFGAFLATGVTFMLAFHIFANIAMTIGLMPVTGKPLPFVSYGGTFMLSNMMAIGLVLNVNMRRDKINF
ncbi:rod shape-determining protein RodA [Serpentinicella alkaliphila]|uniref:Peptidoglycan glycosyltransferase RodA n=1 Tax=Serpentinicella alkaliphila TaxID=1734049 RepID=A0A4R2TPS5_9FIRM|nr:rod shape-determining protein RodA [Serpentinicella alkaliphila]QUH24548.1 rod shape-determining protein RodA [Serpentinicella alkaliphila]TCQ04642.1 rod shape determining protein RodA [Serpentinicella alkaliphila]